MFGAKYSRLTFWIWSMVLLIPFSLFSQLMRATESDPELANSSLIFSVLLFIVAIIWTNALANRIRDYGSDPWIAAFALLPLANIGLALYYGIVRYKNKPIESNTNVNSNPSLTKAVYNHSKDIASEINPTINEYKEKHQTTKSVTSNISSIDEDSIYEKVMIEIDEDKKVKSTWAKALAQSDGDDKKAVSLYINMRVETIKIEGHNRITQDQLLEKEKQDLEYRLYSPEGKRQQIIDEHQSALLHKNFNALKTHLIEYYEDYKYFPKVINDKSLMLKNHSNQNTYILLNRKDNAVLTLEIYNVVYFGLEPFSITLSNNK